MLLMKKDYIIQNRDNMIISIQICLLIGICFLWTGSGYLTWMYRMMDFYPSALIDVLTEVVGYIFQIIGLCLFAYFIKCNKKHFTNKKAFALVMILDFIFMVLGVISPYAILVISFGYLMNLFHGFVAGFYLKALVEYVEQQHRGIVFGIGYAIGSIGSWLLSLLNPNNFLCNTNALFVYAFLIIVSIYLVKGLKNQETLISKNKNVEAFTLTKSILYLSAIVILLLSTVKNVGFYFPSADLGNSGISLEFTRIFYALGLVLAGYVNDKNRQYGAILCIVTIFMPFVMLLLNNSDSSKLILWIISYFLFGFFAVYRVILFSDIAGKNTDYLFLAPLGLMWGRVGDVLGNFIGIAFKHQNILLIIMLSVLFVATIISFLSLYQKIYYAQIALPVKDQETILQEIADKYQITGREMDVFKLVIDGYSNGEIASALYVSENTIKFHIKHLLKKTGCVNRVELMHLVK